VTSCIILNQDVLGAGNLNIQLQEGLNPATPSNVERFGWSFPPGDRGMETQDDYDREVFNGDLGTVVRSQPVRCFRYEFLTAILPSRNVKTSQPCTSIQTPSGLVPVNTHSETPRFPAIKLLISTWN
jgi:hypothetical protein